MITRRDMLKTVLGAAAAAAVAPLIDLTDATPAFWNQPELKKVLPLWRMTFPDGTTWSFEGVVVAENINAKIDSLMEIELTVRPTSMPTIEPGAPRPNVGATVKVANGARLSAPDGKGFDLIDVQGPMVTAEIRSTGSKDGYETFEPTGLKKIGDVTFRGYFEP